MTSPGRLVRRKGTLFDAGSMKAIETVHYVNESATMNETHLGIATMLEEQLNKKQRDESSKIDYIQGAKSFG